MRNGWFRTTKAGQDGQGKKDGRLACRNWWIFHWCRVVPVTHSHWNGNKQNGKWLGNAGRSSSLLIRQKIQPPPQPSKPTPVHYAHPPSRTLMCMCALFAALCVCASYVGYRSAAILCVCASCPGPNQHVPFTLDELLAVKNVVYVWFSRI